MILDFTNQLHKPLAKLTAQAWLWGLDSNLIGWEFPFFRAAKSQQSRDLIKYRHGQDFMKGDMK